MSKKKGLRKCVALALVALLLLSSGLSPRALQQAKPAVVHPKTAAIRAATVEVLNETSEIRKLPVLRPVRSGAQTRKEIEQMLIRNLNESSTPEQMKASEKALKKLGLIPSDFQLRPFILGLLVEQVAGYYDPRTQEFYLAEWIDVDGLKPVMAHELTHALQDQHFNLRRFEKWPEHDSDAELAAHALIEGDAMILMAQYVAKSPARQLAMIRSFLTGESGSTEQFDRAPRVLRETLMFPYSQGAVWAGNVFRRGGWDLLSKAFDELPASTEQILHSEKYFAREAPYKVPWKDLSAQLGKGWKAVDHDVNGEWGYLLILDEHLKSRDVSQKAAEGWHGDRYTLYVGPAAGELVLTQQTVWDTELDAEEFFNAYTKRTSKRYGIEPQPTSVLKRRAWKTAEGVVLLVQNGSYVSIIEGAPTSFKAEALMKFLER
jgi:hypothetical protein